MGVNVNKPVLEPGLHTTCQNPYLTRYQSCHGNNTIPTMTLCHTHRLLVADEEGQKVHTYTILTTDSSKRLEWLHDRMPVILQNEEEAAAWLGEGALPGAAKEAAEAAAAEAAAEKGDHEAAKDAGSAEVVGV